MYNEEYFFTLNPVNFVIISGVLHNFIISCILFWRKTENRRASVLLGLSILVVNLHLAGLMILDTDLDNLFPPVLWIPTSYLTAVGPLIYFFTLSLTRPDFVFTRKNAVHFIPVCIELIFQIVQIIYSIRIGALYYNTPLYFVLTPIIWIWTAGSILWYLRLSVRLLEGYEHYLQTNFSNIGQITLKWLSRLIQRYRTLWILWIPFIVSFLLFFRFQSDFDRPVFYVFVIALYTLMLVITYLTFYIGLAGITRSNIIVIPADAKVTENKSYQNLSDAEANQYIEQLEHLMRHERCFCNENLSLRDLAQRLDADPNLISYLLNSRLNRNFYEYVNTFRVEEVKQKMNDPANRHLTLLAIALECGFNSKTTFNRVFKQFTGLTPSAFVKGKSDHRE